jgi:hypothetical protein
MRAVAPGEEIRAANTKNMLNSDVPYSAEKPWGFLLFARAGLTFALKSLFRRG